MSPAISPRSLRSRSKTVVARSALVFVALGATAATCSAQHGIAIQGGGYDDVDSVGVQWTLPAWFERDYGNWRLAGHPEIQLNRHTRRGDALYQAGAFATLRFQRDVGRVHPYVEAGLGVHYLSRRTIGPTEYSTHYQFGQHLGFGLAWGAEAGQHGEIWLGARFVHLSNAGLKKPNPGLDSLQLVVGHRF